MEPRGPEQRDEHRAKAREEFYQQPQQLAPLQPADNTAPHILPEQVVLPNSLPLSLPSQLQGVPPAAQQQQSHTGVPPPSPAPLAGVGPAAGLPSPDLLARKKFQGGKAQTPDELQSYYDKLSNQRSFARANPGKGAWFWEHLEPQLVRGPDGTPLAVKLHCRCCSLILGASNPSRTASEHLRGGACPNFQKQGAPEPPRKKRVRVSMAMEPNPHMVALGAPDSHHHHELVGVGDPGRSPCTHPAVPPPSLSTGRLRPPVPQLPAAMVNTGAPFTYVSNVFSEIQPPAKGILTHTIRHDQQLRLMLLGFAPGEEMSIPMYAAPYKASATLTFLSGEADVFLGTETIKVYQGGMVHITADVNHTVRAITPVMLMASIMRY